MPTSVEEYRKGKQKVIELPSLLADGTHPKFIIRKPPTKTMLRLLDLLGIKITGDMDPEELEKTVEEAVKGEDLKVKVAEYLATLLPACVVEPKITLDPTEEGALCLDDLEYQDQFALLDAVWEFAGLTEEASKERNL